MKNFLTLVACLVICVVTVGVNWTAVNNLKEKQASIIMNAINSAVEELKGNVEAEIIKYGASFRPSGYTGKLLTRLNEGGSESSFNTSPCTTPDGQTITSNAIGDFIVITVNPGASNEEKISANSVSCSGTTLTWTIVNRGLSFASPTSTVTANKTQHAIGEVVIISNDDQFSAEQYVDIDSAQTIRSVKTFASTTPPVYDVNPNFNLLSSTTFASIGYVASTSYSGTVDGTETVKGIFELATQTEMGSSTSAGGTLANLILWSKYATSSPGSICGVCVVVTDANGKIKPTFLNGTNESYTFNGSTTTITGATALATTTQFGVTAGLVPTGTIVPYASTTAPTGWLLANGAAVSRTAYANLFAVLGTSYGVGDGSTTFNLPNLLGRTPVMASTTANIGQTGGEDRHTMTVSELVAHTHTYNDPFTAGGVDNAVTSTGGGTNNTGSTGDGTPFNVRDPYLAVQYIIKY